MQTITYLRIICEHHIKLDELIKARKLPNEIMARVNHALALIGHLLDELSHPQYSSAYMESQLVDLAKRVNIIEGGIIMSLYCVDFIDCNDGCPNQKLLEAPSEKEVREYMDFLGHTITKIERRR